MMRAGSYACQRTESPDRSSATASRSSRRVRFGQIGCPDTALRDVTEAEFAVDFDIGARGHVDRFAGISTP